MCPPHTFKMRQEWQSHRAPLLTKMDWVKSPVPDMAPCPLKPPWLSHEASQVTSALPILTEALGNYVPWQHFHFTDKKVEAYRSQVYIELLTEGHHILNFCLYECCFPFIQLSCLINWKETDLSSVSLRAGKEGLEELWAGHKASLRAGQASATPLSSLSPHVKNTQTETTKTYVFWSTRIVVPQKGWTASWDCHQTWLHAQLW